VVCQKRQQNVFKINLFDLFIVASHILEEFCDIWVCRAGKCLHKI